MTTQTSDHVTVGAMQVAYTESGKGEPLILVHGGESDRSQFTALRPFLGEGIRAISYDQRDTGDTVNNDDPYTMETFADECIGLMDALGIDKAHIMGISFGGTITMQVGLKYPERVQSLIIGAAPHTMHGPRTPFAEKIMQMSKEERESMMLDAVISPEGQQDEYLMTMTKKAIRGRTTEPGTRRMAAVMEHDVTDRLGEITPPTLLIYGSDDPLAVPSIGEYIHEQVEGSELAIVEGARHGLSFEYREQTAALVRDFVMRHRIEP